MNDTICAISTSPGIGAISIVRVSGPEAINITNEIVNIDLKSLKSHTINYCHVVDKENIIDEVLLMIMLSPKTYTKEDIIEINCHGGINTTNKILSLLIEHGARLAEPGEFTKRAFLNGRIDLTQAEAVNELIVAKTDAARTLAINQVNGKINEEIVSLRDKLAKILANIEVNIDYPEYTDELEVTNKLLTDNLKYIKNSLKQILKDSENGRIVSNGIKIAIIGKPNVGKSSLLNTLLDEQKAIVTDVAGTTRDIVEGSITLNGVQVDFIDTAGIHDTDDVVEKIGVNKSIEVINKADLVILVLDGSNILEKEDKDLLELINNKNNAIVFINKTDIQNIVNIEKTYDIVIGNTKSLEAIRPLKEKIISKFSLNKIVNKDMTYISNIRQLSLIKKSLTSIENAMSLKESVPVDLIEIDIKNAWNYLGEVIGANYADELVDTIFSNFCLGK